MAATIAQLVSELGCRFEMLGGYHYGTQFGIPVQSQSARLLRPYDRSLPHAQHTEKFCECHHKSRCEVSMPNSKTAVQVCRKIRAHAPLSNNARKDDHLNDRLSALHVACTKYAPWLSLHPIRLKFQEDGVERWPRLSLHHIVYMPHRVCIDKMKMILKKGKQLHKGLSHSSA